LRRLVWLTILSAVAIGPACAQGGVGNLPPEVNIVWPPQRLVFNAELIKIKVDAEDTDGSIKQVQVFAIREAETNLIGVVTNAPYNLLWSPSPCGYALMLKAVAEDNEGARTESPPVTVLYACGPPPSSVLQIVSPKDGALLAAPATFTFSAEMLVSAFGTVAAQFFVGTNLVGEVITNVTATAPPVSLTVSNLPAGEYKLSVRDRYANLLPNKSINIRVANLGVQSPHLALDGRFQFDIVTSYPGRQTVIQASENLLDWVPISTNQPASNSFTFTESSPATNSHRFYRVFVPPE
jgi:Bacterial Ig domain